MAFKKNKELTEKISFITGTGEELWNIRGKRPLAPFAPETVDFLDDISKRIRKDRRSADMPDAAAFGFWARRGSVLNMRKPYEEVVKDLLGRPVSLHFAPSNVPALFAYSLSAGLLSGNCVIVRLPSKKDLQREFICRILTEAMEDTPFWKGRIIILSYGHEEEITDALSLLCDARIIWGGDESVNDIRRSPLMPGAIDIPFADRKSAALINASAILKEPDISAVVRNFYKDTYLYDQNACSSPRIVYWVGEAKDIKRASDRFWEELFALVQKKYDMPAIMAAEKLDAACRAGASGMGGKAVFMKNLLVRYQVRALTPDCWEYTAPGGYFIEAFGEDIEGLFPALTRTCQSVAVFGEDPEKIKRVIADEGFSGADRVIPLGQAMEFSLVWDGMDLILMLSRHIV